MAPVIELDNLEVRLGSRTILKRLTGSLSGRAIGLLGPNGAGKSTLINTLLGFYTPVGGSARIFGKDVRNDARTLRRLIGYMPESDSFIADMTACSFRSDDGGTQRLACGGSAGTYARGFLLRRAR
jgi:ABC-2 type transport system ATP-binding protein